MKRTSKISIIILLIIVLGLAGCKPVTPQTYTDSLQRDITLNHPAQKIVSLAPSNTELLFAVGAGAQVVGRDDFSDYPAEVLNIPSVGGSMGDYNLEAIVTCSTTWFVNCIASPRLVKSWKTGLTVYYLGNPVELEDLYTNLETVGKLTGHESDAATLVETMKTRIAAVDELIASATARPVVFYELDATDAAKPWTAGPGTFVDKLISRAGGVNLGSSLSGDWVQISQEELIIQNPEMIILGDAAYGTTPEIVANRAGWENLMAVATNQIFAFDDNLASRPGPRLVDGLVEFARILHPEIAEKLP